MDSAQQTSQSVIPPVPGAPPLPPPPPPPTYGGKASACYTCYRNTPFYPPELKPNEAFVNLQAALRGMRFQSFADAVIRTSDGAEFPAHKCLLAAWSPVLAQELSNSDAKAAANGKAVVELEGLDRVTGELVLDFLYSGEIKLDSVTLKDHGLTLFAFASRYHVAHLKTHLETALARRVDDRSAFDALRVAHTHAAHRLKETASHHVLTCMDRKESAAILKRMLLDDDELERTLAAELMERMWLGSS
eukprot:TRINITY_DN7631_c0_g1_i1.p1 TRINITY_DN7631_c0_g1~~TRINITY_DN7631_c0_g1_i1.p1  ORF type:complete len:247 (+),score=8.91 TRINITY_DN7631_c0_g1_i1:328-1068(+)